MTDAPLPGLERVSPEHRAAARAIFEALQGARRVLLTSEATPDGDAIGAELAMASVARHAFARAGRAPETQVTIINEEGCPEGFRFLEGTAEVRALADTPWADARSTDAVIAAAGGAPPFDVGIVVDGGVERAGKVGPLFDACPIRVCIDHHKRGTRARYDVLLHDAAACSTTELLWSFFADPEIAAPLTPTAAAALYLGLIFDTGSFQYPSTRPLAHEMAAALLDTGFDFAAMHERVLLSQPFEVLAEASRVLAAAERAPDGRLVWAQGSEEALGPKGASRVIQSLCFVDHAWVAVLFLEERPGRTRLSMRSRGQVDVSALARALDPNGGGHARAAGCTLAGPPDAVRRRALDACRAAIDAAR